MKTKGFHEGDRSEHLCQYALSTIGHCVPVPRQSDYFGVDLYLQLFDECDRALASNGDSCAIQIKSTKDPILIDTDEKRLSLYGLSIPFLIAIVDKNENTLSLYSTYFRTALYWSCPNSRFKITFDQPIQFPSDSTTDDVEMLSCGAPIVKLNIAALDTPSSKTSSRILLSAIVKYWVNLETDALAWKAIHLPMLPIVQYKTNKVPTEIPNLLAVKKYENLGRLLSSLKNSLFATYLCTNDHRNSMPLSEKEMEILTAVSDSSLDFCQLLSQASNSMTTEQATATRISYLAE